MAHKSPSGPTAAARLRRGVSDLAAIQNGGPLDLRARATDAGARPAVGVDHAGGIERTRAAVRAAVDVALAVVAHAVGAVVRQAARVSPAPARQRLEIGDAAARDERDRQEARDHRDAASVGVRAKRRSARRARSSIAQRTTSTTAAPAATANSASAAW